MRSATPESSLRRNHCDSGPTGFRDLCELDCTALAATLLFCFDLDEDDAEDVEFELQTFDTSCAAETREWRMAGREVPMRATVGSTCDGIQKVVP